MFLTYLFFRHVSLKDSFKSKIFYTKEVYPFVKELNTHAHNVVTNISYKNIKFYIYTKFVVVSDCWYCSKKLPHRMLMPFLCNDRFVLLIFLIFNSKNRPFYSHNAYLKKSKAPCIHCLYKQPKHYSTVYIYKHLFESFLLI